MSLNASALLSLVDEAITALLTGGHSSYSIGGRTVTRLDLATLMEERRLLQAEVARTNRGGMFRVAKMQRTSR